jgi:hypothetical protein
VNLDDIDLDRLLKRLRLVDDEHVRLGKARERFGEAALAEGGREISRRRSSIGCSSAAVCSTSTAPPCAPGTPVLTPPPSSRHPRIRCSEYPEITGQNYRNPQRGRS